MLRTNPPHAVRTEQQHGHNKHQDTKEEYLKNRARFVTCHDLSNSNSAADAIRRESEDTAENKLPQGGLQSMR
jgi:hypothetical protein